MSKHDIVFPAEFNLHDEENFNSKSYKQARITRFFEMVYLDFNPGAKYEKDSVCVCFGDARCIASLC